MYFGQEQGAAPPTGGGGYFGPNQGGGSLPQMVMRTGMIQPFNARDARNDIGVNRIENLVQLPTGQMTTPAMESVPMAGYFGADAAALPSAKTGVIAFIAAFGLLAAFGVWRSR